MGFARSACLYGGTNWFQLSPAHSLGRLLDFGDRYGLCRTRDRCGHYGWTAGSDRVGRDGQEGRTVGCCGGLKLVGSDYAVHSGALSVGESSARGLSRGW